MRGALNAELHRSGTGPVQILKRASDVPAGLSHLIIQSWASDGPKPGTVGQAHWDYVMARLRALPDGASSSTLSLRALRSLQVEINADDLTELRHHREQTGIGGAILLRNAPDKPSVLSPAIISAWLSGEAKKAVPDLVAYVLACDWVLDFPAVSVAHAERRLIAEADVLAGIRLAVRRHQPTLRACRYTRNSFL